MSATWEIREGDVLARLAELPDESVQCVVTSPPYWGLRDYGVEGQIGLEETVDEYLARMVEVFREVRRVLRSDGVLWLNMGDAYAGSWGAQGRSGQMADRSIVSARQISEHPKRQSKTDSLSRSPGLKPKDLIGMPWKLAFALQADGWWLRMDVIWCLSGGTRVYARTQKGDMPMTIKDLVRLDPSTVQLWNGERWTQVLGWNESRRDEPLEIELRSGERIGCTPDHVWPTQRGDVRAADLIVGDVIDTVRLPEPEEVYSPTFIGQRIAWMAGLYLAEGSRDSNDRLQFAGHAEQTGDRLAALAPLAEAFGGTARVHTAGNAATVIVDCPALSAIVGQYVHGRTAKTKGVKVRAWKHNDEWLGAFVQGYLDGDGHHDKDNDRWRLGFTRNDRLAGDLRTLAARLGATITLKAATGEGFGETWPIYRGEWRWSRSGHHNERDRSEVVAIRRSRARKLWDIGVADAPHTFTLASGVLTHNSKPNPMPESVTDRPTKAHEYMFLLAKGQRKTRVVDFTDLPSERCHFGEDGGFHAPNSWTGVVCVRLATAILNFAESDNRFCLPPLDSEVWKQGAGGCDSDFVRSLPVEHGAAAWAARLLRSDATTKQFLCEVDRMWVALADSDDLLVRWAPSVLADAPGVYRYGKGTIAIHDAGKVSKISFLHKHLVHERPSGCSYFYDADAVREEAVKGSADAGARNYRAGTNGNQRKTAGQTEQDQCSGRNLRSVWEIATQPYPEAHFATFPTKLVEPCIKAGTSEKGCCAECGAPWERVVEKAKVGDWRGGRDDDLQRGQRQQTEGDGVEVQRIGGSHYKAGWHPPRHIGWRPTCDHDSEPVPCTVLDPFSGSGTTGMVALRLGRSYIGIELNPEYAELSRKRIDGDCPLFNRQPI